MSQIDLERQRRICRGEFRNQQNNRFLQEGFPESELEYAQAHNPARILALPAITSAFEEITDGDVLHVGAYRLTTISVPGHTPGNCVFWDEEHGILFSGDHILFDITPNITAWPEVEDSLGSYLDSLEKIKCLPVRQTLPGHRKTGDFHKRTDVLLQHHLDRLNEVLKIMEENPGLSAYEIAGKMTWKIRSRNWQEFPPVQKVFAVGECLAHLDYLRGRGNLFREEREGVYRYRRLC